VKAFGKYATALCLCAASWASQRASGAIVVTSTVDGSAEDVRAQAVIENTSTFGEGPLGVAVKEFRATIIVRDNVSPDRGNGGPSLLVQKHHLTAAQAYGLGQPNGYTQPPFTDPEGPWFGLTWPYRDQYDYFAQPGNPLADDVGIPFSDQPDVYGFVNIVGIARGGPTEPNIPPPGSPSPNWLNRGQTGNGLDGPATYFNFDISSLSGDPDRFVRVRIVAASAVVVQKDANGAYSEVTIPVPDSGDFFIQLPEPSSAIIGLAGLGLTMARRRGRRAK
jgi:hypothetical protein